MNFIKKDYITLDGTLYVDLLYVNCGEPVGWVAYILNDIDYKGRDTSCEATLLLYDDDEIYPLRTHPLYDEIPAEPNIVLESGAESEYYAQNKHIKENVARILSRGQYISNGGMIAGTRRTEVRYNVSKQKQKRG